MFKINFKKSSPCDEENNDEEASTCPQIFNLPLLHVFLFKISLLQNFLFTSNNICHSNCYVRELSLWKPAFPLRWVFCFFGLSSQPPPTLLLYTFKFTKFCPNCEKCFPTRIVGRLSELCLRKAPPPPPPLKWGPVSGVPLRLHNLTLRLTWSTVDSLPARLVNFRSTVNKAEQDLHNSTPCLTNQPAYMFTQHLCLSAQFDLPPHFFCQKLWQFWQCFDFGHAMPCLVRFPASLAFGRASGLGNLTMPCHAMPIPSPNVHYILQSSSLFLKSSNKASQALLSKALLNWEGVRHNGNGAGGKRVISLNLLFCWQNMRIYNLRCELVDAVLSHRPPFPIQGRTWQIDLNSIFFHQLFSQMNHCHKIHQKCKSTYMETNQHHKIPWNWRST